MFFPGRRRVGILITVLTAVAAVAPADARVRLAARFPPVATAGGVVRVPGRVGGSARALRVVLEQRRGAGWRVRARSLAAGRFVLRWRAPGTAGVVKLRVAVLRRGRRLAATPVRRVAVSATRVLTPGAVVEGPPPGTAGTVRYAGRVAARVGQFVAADVGPQTPFGLLGRVVAVRLEGGDTVLSIEPASLLEAVPAGRVAFEEAAAARRARLHAAAARRGFRSAFKCSAGPGAELAGSLAVRLIPRFKLAWSPEGVERAEATATVRGHADLSARIGAAGFCALRQTRVAVWDAPPLRLAVGPIPVVVVPRTALYVAGEAEVDAGVETGIHGHVSATAGLRYDGRTHPIGRFRHVLSYTPPRARVSGSVAARLIPSVTFLLYGQAGPRFDLAAGLQLDATATGSPWWTLSAPVELSAGLDVPNLGGPAIPQRTVFSKTFPLGEADPDPAPAVGSDPPASPDAGRGVERARISWNTAATDVDLHVWDESGHHAWFREPSGVPDGELSEDDRYGFGPEHFFDRAGGRTLTYGLCYFDDSGAGATSVDVRLTDPGGTVRESSRTLAHEGDHVLLGSSPGGSGYVPPDGWCRP